MCKELNNYLRYVTFVDSQACSIYIYEAEKFQMKAQRSGNGETNTRFCGDAKLFWQAAQRKSSDFAIRARTQPAKWVSGMKENNMYTLYKSI